MSDLRASVLKTFRDLLEAEHAGLAERRERAAAAGDPRREYARERRITRAVRDLERVPP